MTPRNVTESHSSLVFVLVIVGLLGYVQPWIVLSSGPLTLNGYDLAEWASLVPIQRSTTPPLLAPLLLRLPLVILSLLLGAAAVGRKRMAISAAAICLLAAAQLPPFEFVYDINNLNYRQQAGLAILSLIAGFCLLPLARRRFLVIAWLALATVGIVSAVFGLTEALALYRQYQLDAAPGAGIWILSLVYAVLLALALRSMVIGRRARS